MKKGMLFYLILILTACGTTHPTPADNLPPTENPTPPSTTYTLTPEQTVINAPSPTATPTITPIPNHPVGRVILHEPTDSNLYYWYSYVPRSLEMESSNYILVTGIRAEADDSYENLIHIARGEIERRINMAEQNKFILIVPHIPRQDQPHIYTAAFDRQVFSSSTDTLYQRPDLKINIMIDEIVMNLKLDGYNVQEKVFLEGHSIGGLFSQRYALLHPDRVQAIAAQSGGDITLPISSKDSIELPWPIGISDLTLLSEIDFNVELYMLIPQYIYTGEDDIGPDNPLEINYGGVNSVLWDMGWDTSTAKRWIAFVYDTFGNNAPIQTKNQIKFLNEIGFKNISFKLYYGVGHQQTEKMMEDILTFFENYR